MRKSIFTLFLLCAAWSGAVAQDSHSADYYAQKGIELHEKGDYKGAIDYYMQALKVDSGSSLVKYEIAYSYYAMEDYANAEKYAKMVLDKNAGSMEPAYILYANLLDDKGQTEEAIKVYAKGLKQFKQSYLLHFNLGTTLLIKKKDVAGAEKQFKEALTINPTHSGSHLMLAQIMMYKDQRVQAMLPLYYYLLLSPRGSKSGAVYKTLSELMMKGVSKGDSSINITFQGDVDDAKDNPFVITDMILSMKTALLVSEKDKKDIDKFVDISETLFSSLSELEKKKMDPFWKNTYAKFFSAMHKAGLNETFCYYISQSQDDDIYVRNWFKINDNKVTDLSKWYKQYYGLK